MQIWKFPITPSHDEYCRIEIPAAFRLLSVQMQNGKPVLYALVDPETKTLRHSIAVIGTGWDAPDGLGEYLGTFMTGNQSGLVFHVFNGTA